MIFMMKNSKLNNEELAKKLKSLQSQRCRLKKQTGRPDYAAKMAAIESAEQEVRSQLEASQEVSKRSWLTLNQEQINQLDYEDTCKALKSVQSKKCNTQYMANQDEFKAACELEEKLKKHRKLVETKRTSLWEKLLEMKTIEEVHEYAKSKIK